jgi:hypothetical protein
VNRRSRLLLVTGCCLRAVVHAIYAVLMHLSNVSGEYLGTMFNHGARRAEPIPTATTSRAC